MGVITSVILGLLLLVLGPLLLLISRRWLFRDDVSDRLEEFTSMTSPHMQPLTQERYEQRFDLTGSFMERTIRPLFRRIGRLLGRFTPAQTLEKQEHQMILAGHPMGLGAREFTGLRIALTMLGVLLSLLLLRQEGLDNRNILLVSILTVVVCVLLPVVWLRRLIRERQHEILKGLPDALDMLSVCATAGLGFDQSLQRVSEYWQTTMGREFGRVIKEMEMGLSRREALKNLAFRTDVPELSSFISLIIQAEILGMSISNTINGMAEQMRIERRFRAQEEARKLPNKILFPLVFFIFPSMIAVILGPSVPQLIDLFTFLGQN